MQATPLRAPHRVNAIEANNERLPAAWHGMQSSQLFQKLASGMSELRDEFCRSIKNRYPAISAKADEEYQRLWGDFTDASYDSYSWFEALANAINKDMGCEVPASEHQELLAVISSYFEFGDESVRKCIDVAFVENLFWQVPKTQSVTAYWGFLPNNLKDLYIDFHHQSPL